MKKFWDASFPGGAYDAIGRRGPKPSSPKPSRPLQKAIIKDGTWVRAHLCVDHATARPQATVSAHAAAPQQRTSSVASDLHAKLAQLKLTLSDMEKERDFYFGKLRDIEILTQQVADTAILGSTFFQQITAILYKTEEGFEIPPENTDAAVLLLSK